MLFRNIWVGQAVVENLFEAGIQRLLELFGIRKRQIGDGETGEICVISLRLR